MGMLTPLKAIRKKCLDCAGSSKEVTLCPCGPEHPEPCSLYPFRFSENPNRAGIGNIANLAK